MDSPLLAALRARRADADRDLLRALAARARCPRDSGPGVSDEVRRRLPPPPLAEILYALAPAGAAGDAAAAQRDLLAALAAREQVACEIADAKAAIHSDDFHAALALGDRERLAELLADLADELRTLDFIRAAAPQVAPELDPDLALFLWREHVLPWARQTEIDHLAAP